MVTIHTFWQDMLGKMGHETLLDFIILHIEKSEIMKESSPNAMDVKTSTYCAHLQWLLAVLIRTAVISC